MKHSLIVVCKIMLGTTLQQQHGMVFSYCEPTGYLCKNVIIFFHFKHITKKKLQIEIFDFFNIVNYYVFQICYSRLLQMNLKTY